MNITFRFEEYIEYLRENMINLAEYREKTGVYDPKIQQIKEDLFDEDPFIVFGASLSATLILSDKSIFH